MKPAIDPGLVTGVDLLCLDAGNTVIFLDHERLADLTERAAGMRIAPEVLVRSEGEAKRRAEEKTLVEPSWADGGRPGAIGWGRMVGTIVHLAGVPLDRVGPLLELAWPEHTAKNLWWKIPDGLGDALDEARAAGTKVAIVSNSEGMLDRLFADLGLLPHFDLVVDSGKVGFEKPDPRIFRVAFEHFRVKPSAALHLGDMIATDIDGARAAGCRYALVDPFGHVAGRHPDVPRVPGAPEVARAIAAAKR